MERRDYRGMADLRAMQRAVQRTWTPASQWHVGDLAWGRLSTPGLEPRWRTALWHQRGEVVAWAWVEIPDSLVMYVDPSHPGLAAEVLAWFDDVAHDSPGSVTAVEDDDAVVAALEGAGYRPLPDAPFFDHCVIDLDDTLATPTVPAGYVVRALRPDEAAARAAVHRAAWRPSRIGSLLVPPVDLGTAESQLTTSGYQAVMDGWPYRLDLDQVVEAPDGTLVAFALGWLDADNRAGELEPVGTDPRHARRGLGAVVSLACLGALRRAGASRAVVYPRGDSAYPVARRLYLQLGFRPVARTVTYRQGSRPRIERPSGSRADVVPEQPDGSTGTT